MSAAAAIIGAAARWLTKRLIEPKLRAPGHVSNRIRAVALAHDQLAPQHDAKAIELRSYLGTLCTSIEQQAASAVIDVGSDEVELGIDRAIPLSLTVNETVTNSVKYAFDGQGGKITTRLIAGVGYGEVKLVATDYRKGMRDSSKPGTGLTLICSLARQTAGEFERTSSETGTETG